MFKKTFCSFIFLFVIVFSADHFSGAMVKNISDDIQDKLDSIVASIMKEKNLPSVVVLLDIPDEGTYILVKGKANLETGLERAPLDQYRTGSISKTFIATAILQLVDSGKISTSDKLSKWYPDFPNSEIITVKDLLMMRSGVYDSWDKERLTEYYKNPLIDLTADDMIRFSAEKANLFKPPDREGIYVNLNYILLEKIVEKVTGRKINEVLDEYIFKPLGMSSSLVPVGTGLPGNLHGYSFDSSLNTFVDKTILNPNPVGGAGAIISNINDLKTYARILYNGGLLSPETQKQRLDIKPLKDVPDFIGYGEGIMKFGKFFGHNGTINGFSSEMFYLPERDAVLIINVNRLDLDDVSQSALLFQTITKTIFPEYVNW